MVVAKDEILYEEFIERAKKAGLTKKEHFFDILKSITKELKTQKKSLCKLVVAKFLPSHLQIDPADPQSKFTNLENYTPINYFLEITGSDPHIKKLILQQYDNKNVCGYQFVKFPDNIVELFKKNMDMFYYTRSISRKTLENKKKKLKKELDGEGIEGYIFVELPLPGGETALYVAY